MLDFQTFFYIHLSLTNSDCKNLPYLVSHYKCVTITDCILCRQDRYILNEKKTQEFAPGIPSVPGNPDAGIARTDVCPGIDSGNDPG